MIITLVFEKNAKLFCRKLPKIAENCDHNIDPWWRGLVALRRETESRQDLGW
jgi:hypothetical protein